MWYENKGFKPVRFQSGSRPDYYYYYEEKYIKKKIPPSIKADMKQKSILIHKCLVHTYFILSENGMKFYTEPFIYFYYCLLSFFFQCNNFLLSYGLF